MNTRDGTMPRGGRWVADDVVETLRILGTQVVVFNPGASFRALQDALVHGGPEAPRAVLALDEGSAVAVAHGYAKASHAPTAVLLHDVVGLLRGSMGIFNAYCDRAPLLLIGGSGPLRQAARRPWIDWIHSARAQAAAIERFVRYEDQPAYAEEVVPALVRAWSLALSPPAGPVYLCLDQELQESASPAPSGREVAPVLLPGPPAPPPDAAAALSDSLARARRPVAVVGYLDDRPGAAQEVADWAEEQAVPLINAGVRLGVLDGPADVTAVAAQALASADLVLFLDVDDLDSWLGHIPAGAELWHVGFRETAGPHWADIRHRFEPRVRDVRGSPLWAIRMLQRGAPSAERRRVWVQRRQEAQAQRSAWREQAAAACLQATAGPVPAAGLAWALEQALSPYRWCLGYGGRQAWLGRLCRFRAEGTYYGHEGGAGLGHGVGHAAGVALARRHEVDIVLAWVGDGEILYAPGALWTAAHERLPLLVVVHNNRGYGNTRTHARHMADRRGREQADLSTGVEIERPPVALCDLARSYGVHALGPLAGRPGWEEELREAAAYVVAEGRPVLVEVMGDLGSR
ncbi:MAG: hypothetical protein K6V73_09635 [Firmicutes bacterium]|nr:hypothetical protein [Bacillota bacterium]